MIHDETDALRRAARRGGWSGLLLAVVYFCMIVGMMALIEPQLLAGLALLGGLLGIAVIIAASVGLIRRMKADDFSPRSGSAQVLVILSTVHVVIIAIPLVIVAARGNADHDSTRSALSLFVLVLALAISFGTVALALQNKNPKEWSGKIR